MPYRILEAQPTPNPNAVKFVLDRSITDQPLSFRSPQEAKKNPLADELFSIDGVISVLMLGDFITVNKRPGVRWPTLKKRVREVLSKS